MMALSMSRRPITAATRSKEDEGSTTSGKRRWLLGCADDVSGAFEIINCRLLGVRFVELSATNPAGYFAYPRKE
jgi:hypothetical protein